MKIIEGFKSEAQIDKTENGYTLVYFENGAEVSSELHDKQRDAVEAAKEMVNDSDLNTMLGDYEDTDELKRAKKLYTKKMNDFANAIKADAESFNEVAHNDHRLRVKAMIADGLDPYKDKDEMDSALFNLWSFHPYPNSFEKHLQNVELIKADYKDLYELVKPVLDKHQTQAFFLLSLEKHLEEQREILKGKSFAARALARAAAKSDQNKLALMEYSRKLGKWSEPEIVDNTLVINGHATGQSEDVWVGVLIGAGDRLHPMRAYIGEYEDEETKEMVKAVFLRNHTQWRRSHLCIVDLWENVPDNVKADR